MNRQRRIYLLLLVVQSVSAQWVQTSNLPSSCNTNTYFDSTQLACVACPANLVPTANCKEMYNSILIETSCQCDRGFIVNQTTLSNFFPTCIACGPVSIYKINPFRDWPPRETRPNASPALPQQYLTKPS